MITNRITEVFESMKDARVTTNGPFKRIYYQNVWVSFFKICPGFYTAKLFIDGYNARVPRLEGKKKPTVIGFCLDGPMTLYEEELGGIHLTPGEAIISSGMPYTYVGASYGKLEVLLFYFDQYITKSKFFKRTNIDSKFFNIEEAKLVTCSEYVKFCLPTLISLSDPEKLRRLHMSLLLDMLSSSSIYDITLSRHIPGKFIERAKRMVSFVLENKERAYLASELSIMYELSVETVKTVFNVSFGCRIEEYPEKRREPVMCVPWLTD